jgi:dienelactone hydrolase
VAAAEAAIGPGTRLPSVLFVHGCGGFGNSGRVIARLLATAGYAVFAPDSFARPGRPETCDSRSRRSIVPGAVLDRVYAMRAAEIGYGRARLAEIPWVDRDNLFLVGHSQGGTAAAAHPGGGFKARVIGGSACKRGYGAAPGAPALAVTSRHDPWLKRDGSRCDRYAVGSALEVVELSGDAHVAAEVPEGRRAILAFLARHTEARRP